MVDDEDLDGTVWQSTVSGQAALESPLRTEGNKRILSSVTEWSRPEPAAEFVFGRNRSKVKQIPRAKTALGMTHCGVLGYLFVSAG